MSMLKVDKLTFAYPGSYDNIFEIVSFQVDTSWRLGFVGRNGRGKTTFLQLLANSGQYEYSGNITVAGGVKFAYFPWEPADKNQLTLDVLQQVCPEAELWQLERELAILKLADEALWRPFGSLSNGEQTKALLAAMFLQPGHFLLLDEPTNHLDEPARRLVANYLRRQQGFILVSHDRQFLDGCVDHILSLNRANIEVQNGNFSCWLAGFEQRNQAEAAQQEQLHKDIKRLRQAARRASDWSDKVEAGKYGNGPVDRGFIGHKSAKMMKRAKSIEARQQQAIEQKAGLLQNLERAEDLKLQPLRHHADILLECSGLCASIDGRVICQPPDFCLHRGERLALAGPNGCGKSTLLRLLLGQAPAKLQVQGQLRAASGLIISYIPQDTSFLRGRLRDFAQAEGLDESLFLTILRKLDFSRQQFEKEMERYSEGQKKKVLLAKSLCQPAHLYVWDEPLNYIDIYSRLQIEQLIAEFAPTMLLVEHDEAFRQAVCTGCLNL